MRLRSLFHEAIRNIISGTTRFALFGLVLSMVNGSLILAEFLVISQQLHSANAFRASGASTVTLAARGQVDGAACENLSKIPGVVAAGALRQAPQRITLNHLPEAPVPAFEVTAGFPSVLSATRAQGAGLVISAEVARTLGAVPGDVLSTTEGPVPVAAIYSYPADGRRPGFGYAALSVTSDRHAFDECWVKAWPQISNLRAILFVTLEPGPSDPKNPPTLSQLNSSFGENFAPGETFLTRITRWAAPFTLVLSLVVGFVSIRVRRLQLASALHAGIAKSDLFSLVSLETAAWAVSATAIGAGLAVLTSSLVSPEDGIAVLAAEGSIPLVGLFGAVGGAGVAVLFTRERHLFRYFKER